MAVEVSLITKYWMALSSVTGVGPKTVRILVNRFGSPQGVLSAPVIEIARMPRLNLKLAREIVGVGRRLSEFENFIAQMSREQIDVLCPDSSEYPHLLKLIEDFPPILYKKGARLSGNVSTVAIVGTRSPTSNGVEAAETIAERLADMGIVVISGLAAGIDTAAHKGALRAGGRTFAVLGSGLKMVYPYGNSQLADEISANGAVLSECHPNEVVSGQRLIPRNRIISGLSLGVILIEPKKGALNTAERALRQGRHIFVYKQGGDGILAPSLSEAAFPISGVDELNVVVNRLRTMKNKGGQISFL